MTRTSLPAVLVTALLTTGCLAIPVPESEPGTGRAKDEVAASSLRVGITTREEVLLTLGEPEFVHGMVFRYTGRDWWRWRGVTVVAAPGLILPVPFAAGERDSVHHTLTIEFDAGGVVKRVERWRGTTGAPR
jgi:outer membrane protein assembly factor BamE (lipoprotein component of BamABCDE complex)